jgi:hypothetical protein
MKRLGTVLLFGAVCLCTGIAKGGQVSDTVDSFNGYTLETPVSSYASLNLIKQYSTDFVQDVTVYEKPGEVLTLEVVPIKTVRYRFADGLLESVQLTYAGRENRDRLLGWVEAHYGKLPSQERRVIAQVMWHGEKMMIMLNYNRSYDQGTLWFISPRLHKEMNRLTGATSD